ncbi:MAG: HAD family hydrolase [Chloroflexi bacterium]|nr:HAD family hydrolase [Chloroflexota bacterium]
MIHAITFDFWDTLVADNSDEPRRAALGLPTGAQAILQLLVDEIISQHPAIQPEQIVEAYARVRERFNYHWKNEQRTPPVSARLRELYDALQIPPAPGLEHLARKIEDVGVLIPPLFVPGVTETLAELSRRYALGIISDTINVSGRGIRTLLERQGVLNYFRSLVFSDEAGASKPARAVFERAANELGVPLENIAHVGDRESNDVEGALAAGMKAILFTGAIDRASANTRAHTICRAFSDLPQAIRKLDAD